MLYAATNLIIWRGVVLEHAGHVVRFAGYHLTIA